MIPLQPFRVANITAFVNGLFHRDGTSDSTNQDLLVLSNLTFHKNIAKFCGEKKIFFIFVE